MRDAFGIACLVLGAVCVLAQVFLSYAAEKHAKSGGAAQQAQQAAQKVKDAATDVREAAQLSQLASAQLERETLGNESLSGIADQIGEAVRTATEKAKTADRKADDAEKEAEEAQKTAGTSRLDVINTVAGKVPLGMLGFLFAVLGALVLEYVTLTAAAGAG